MQITKLSLEKSKTVGFLDQYNKTRFTKIRFAADAELDESDNPKEKYNELSSFIDECIKEEVKRK